MRYTRLRRQIEGGTLIGTHGASFSGGFDKPATLLGKRKLSKRETSAAKSKVRRVNKMKIKNEYDETSDEHETDPSEYVESEDEVPLARRKPVRLLIESPQLSMPSSNARNANATSKMQSEEIPIVLSKPMFCSEPTTIDQDNAVSVDSQSNVNSIQQLSNYPYKTVVKQAAEVVPYPGPERWNPSIKISTQPPHRPISVSGGINDVHLKASTGIGIYHHKASVDIESKEGRI